MTAHSTEETKDEQLADFTDALLEGQASPDSDQLQPREAEIVRILARTVGPKSVPDQLRRDLARKISAEFSPERTPFFRGLWRSIARPSQRWLWATAALMAIVAIAAVFLFPLDGSQITGTVTGEIGAIALIFGIVLIGALVIAWRASRR